MTDFKMAKPQIAKTFVARIIGSKDAIIVGSFIQVEHRAKQVSIGSKDTAIGIHAQFPDGTEVMIAIIHDGEMFR